MLKRYLWSSINVNQEKNEDGKLYCCNDEGLMKEQMQCLEVL